MYTVCIEIMIACYVTHFRNRFRRPCVNESTRFFYSNYNSAKKLYTEGNIHCRPTGMYPPAKIRKPAWERGEAERCSVDLIHELLPAVIFLLLHSIPSAVFSPSYHQPALWQIHLADTRYPSANPTTKCRPSKIRACLCSFNFTLGLSKRCQAQRNELFDWAVFSPS